MICGRGDGLHNLGFTQSMKLVGKTAALNDTADVANMNFVITKRATITTMRFTDVPRTKILLQCPASGGPPSIPRDMHFCLLEYPNVPFAEARLALVDDGWGVQEVRFAFAQNVSLWKPKMCVSPQQKAGA